MSNEIYFEGGVRHASTLYIQCACDGFNSMCSMCDGQGMWVKHHQGDLVQEVLPPLTHDELLSAGARALSGYADPMDVIRLVDELTTRRTAWDR